MMAPRQPALTRDPAKVKEGNRIVTSTSEPGDTAAGRLTHGPIGARLLRMALPMVWGHLAIVLFNLTDAWQETFVN